MRENTDQNNTDTFHAVTFSNSLMETPKQYVKFLKSYQERHQNNLNDVAVVSFLLTFNKS